MEDLQINTLYEKTDKTKENTLAISYMYDNNFIRFMKNQLQSLPEGKLTFDLYRHIPSIKL